MLAKSLGISLSSLVLLVTSLPLVTAASAQNPPVTVTFSLQNYNTGPSPAGVVSGDFNQDGQPDLAVIDSQSNSVQFLLGQGGGLFSLGARIATGAGPSQIVTGTFTVSGRQDLAVAQPRKLPHAYRRGRHVTAQVALALVAHTSAAQIFQREDAVVTVDPLHADGVAPYFVQPFDLRSL